MNDDIVERLRKQRTNSVLCAEAADEIERLRADVKRWFKLADGMAGCLDSSCEAGDLLNEYERAVRGE